MDLYEYSLLTIFLIGLATILGASEIGRRFGLWAAGRGGDDVFTLESAVLGLLALIIAFTFAMALSRFDARRDAVLDEANTIATTALRARLLPEPQRTESIGLLKQYVKIRLEIAGRPMSSVELMTAINRSNLLQESLWQQAKEMAAKNSGVVPTGLFIRALNEMIDSQEKRLTALRNRIPDSVLLLVFGLAAAAGAFIGYASEVNARRTRLPVYLFGLLVSVVIIVILDLDRPSSGFIKVSQQPMIDTAAAIAAFSD
jgi:hypothetical protein